LFIVSLAVIPWLVTKIPVDYFQPQYRIKARAKRKKSVVTQVLVSIKHLFGFGIICLGVIMLMTPGQGLLTILVGLVLTDFPGKHRIEQKLLLRYTKGIKSKFCHCRLLGIPREQVCKEGLY